MHLVWIYYSSANKRNIVRPKNSQFLGLQKIGFYVLRCHSTVAQKPWVFKQAKTFIGLLFDRTPSNAWSGSATEFTGQKI